MRNNHLIQWRSVFRLLCLQKLDFQWGHQVQIFSFLIFLVKLFHGNLILEERLKLLLLLNVLVLFGFQGFQVLSLFVKLEAYLFVFLLFQYPLYFGCVMI